MDVYFLFILHVPWRARAALLRLISMSPNWPKIHSTKCFRTTETVGGGRETNCALVFNCFLTEIGTCHFCIYLIGQRKITWPHPHEKRMHMYKHCMCDYKVKGNKYFMKNINDSHSPPCRALNICHFLHHYPDTGHSTHCIWIFSAYTIL